MNEKENYKRKIIDFRLKNDYQFWVEYDKILATITEWEFKITSHFMLISGSIFAIMVSLRSNEFDSCYSFYLFRISMILCATCILFGSLFLYSYVDINKKSAGKILHNAIDHAIEGTDAAFDGVQLVRGRKIFWYCKLICWISFLGSIIFLTFYSTSFSANI